LQASAGRTPDVLQRSLLLQPQQPCSPGHLTGAALCVQTVCSGSNLSTQPAALVPSLRAPPPAAPLLPHIVPTYLASAAADIPVNNHTSAQLACCSPRGGECRLPHAGGRGGGRGARHLARTRPTLPRAAAAGRPAGGGAAAAAAAAGRAAAACAPSALTAAAPRWAARSPRWRPACACAERNV